MEDFSSNSKNKNNSNNKNEIDKGVLMEIKNKQRFGIFDKQRMDKFYVDKTQMNDKFDYAMSKVQINLVTSGYIFFLITTNSIFYKILIKKSKKILNLKGFWPNNFAVFIPMTFINFTLIGIFDGLLGSIIVKNQLKNLTE